MLNLLDAASNWWIWTLIAVAVIIVLVVVIVLIVKSGKKKGGAEEENSAAGDEGEEDELSEEEKAELIAEEDEEDEPEEEAVAAEDKAAEPEKAKKFSYNKVYHISTRKSDGKWQVKAAGGAKALKLFDTQAQAIEFAKQVAGNQEAKIMIHKEDGSFRRLSYK